MSSVTAGKRQVSSAKSRFNISNAEDLTTRLQRDGSFSENHLKNLLLYYMLICDRIVHDSYPIVIDCKESIKKLKGVQETDEESPSVHRTMPEPGVLRFRIFLEE